MYIIIIIFFKNGFYLNCYIFPLLIIFSLTPLMNNIIDVDKVLSFMINNEIYDLKGANLQNGDAH